MVKSRDFWVGVVLGIILLYIYQTQIQKKGKGGGA